MEKIILKLEEALAEMEKLPVDDWELLWPQAVNLANLIAELRNFHRYAEREN